MFDVQRNQVPRNVCTWLRPIIFHVIRPNLFSLRGGGNIPGATFLQLLRDIFSVGLYYFCI
jgi:hypothetical protein